MSQSAFEQYLKNSDHFVGTMNAHRAATAEVIAGFAQLLMDNNQVSKESVAKLLGELQAPGSGPSIDVGRRTLTARIADKLNIRAQ